MICGILDTASLIADPTGDSIYRADLSSLTVGEAIHGLEPNIETGLSMIYSHDGNPGTLVLDLPARSAFCRVPA